MLQVPGAPTYGSLKVDAAAIPGVRKTAAETPDSLGAGAALARARTAETIGEVGGAMARLGSARYKELVERERDQADELAVLTMQRKIGDWELKRLHDPVTGALAVRGEAAMPLPEQVLGEFDALASEVGSSATTDRQKAAFARLALERRAHLELTVRRHVFGEMQQFRVDELEGVIETSVTAAVTNALDPARVSLELGHAVDALRANAPALGMGPKELEARVFAVQSRTHDGVIRRLLAHGKDKQAGIYLEEARGQISDKVLPDLEKAVKEGGAISTAQQSVDRIVAAGGTLTEQRAAIKAELTGRERELALQMVDHEAAIRDRVTREADEGRMREAYDLIDRGRGIRDVMRLESWSSFSGNVRSALRNYAENIARGVPVQTDIATYYSLVQMAGTDPQKFAQENLLAYRAKLGETEFKQLATSQLEVRKGNREAAAKILGGPQSALQVVNGSLEQMGVDPSPKAGSPEAGAIAQLRGIVDRRVEDLQALTGKPATNQEIRAIVDEALFQQSKPGSSGTPWNGSLFGPSGVFGGASRMPWGAEEAVRVIDVRNVRDVPAATRKEIEAGLVKRNMPVTDAVILSIYRDMLWNRK